MNVRKWIVMPVRVFVSVSKGVIRCIARTRKNLPVPPLCSDKASKQPATSNNVAASPSVLDRARNRRVLEAIALQVPLFTNTYFSDMNTSTR